MSVGSKCRDFYSEQIFIANGKSMLGHVKGIELLNNIHSCTCVTCTVVGVLVNVSTHDNTHSKGTYT